VIGAVLDGMVDDAYSRASLGEELACYHTLGHCKMMRGGEWVSTLTRSIAGDMNLLTRHSTRNISRMRGKDERQETRDKRQDTKTHR
jgi:hypothetical protein